MDLRKIKMSLGDARAPTAFLLGCWSRWSGMGWKNQIKNGEVALTPCRREKEELEANCWKMHGDGARGDGKLPLDGRKIFHKEWWD